jgi:hypothetical protein
MRYIEPQAVPDPLRNALIMLVILLQVVPFTPSAGVLEWVDGTIPLGDYLLGRSVSCAISRDTMWVTLKSSIVRLSIFDRNIPSPLQYTVWRCPSSVWRQ